MASTISLTGDWLVSLGNRRMSKGTGNLGNPYAAGGIAITPNQVGLGQIDEMIIFPAGGYVFEYVPSTGKIKAYDQTDPANAGGADIPLAEVGAVDLSGTTFRFVAIGR